MPGPLFVGVVPGSDDEPWAFGGGLWTCAGAGGLYWSAPATVTLWTLVRRARPFWVRTDAMAPSIA